MDKIEGIEIKNYSNYDEYLKHQKSKADYGTPLRQRLLGELWESDCEGFRLNFKPFEDILSKCKNALCLGARVGQEVFILKEMGIENSLGIDLTATPPLVIEGDVHDLKFEDESYDFIFSNIFDHVLYPEKFISEIERVLKPGGHCLLHLSVMDTQDTHSANILHGSHHVVSLFKQEIEIIEDKLLDQPDWPHYWTLMIKKIA